MIDRGHIAFKVTYNDMNWKHVCSPKLFKINSKKVFFCKDNSCQLYHNRELNPAPCNDCVANRDLKFGPGDYMQKDKPHVCKRTKIGDIAFFTSLKPGAPQNERFIFTIYKIKSIVDVDEYIENSSKYYIGDKYSAIYLDPSQHINFWDFYTNNLSNEKFSYFWGAGLFRYMSNKATELILKRIIDHPIFYGEQKTNARYLLESLK